jgi:hypothetical protein
VHSINVGPDFTDGCVDCGSNQGGSVITSSTFKIVNFSFDVSADVTLGDEKVNSGVVGESFMKFGSNNRYLWFFVSVDAHEIKSMKESMFDVCFLEVNAEEFGAHKFSLGKDIFIKSLVE